MTTQSSRKKQSDRTWTCLLITLILIVGIVCAGGWMVYRLITQSDVDSTASTVTSERDVVLNIAYSPEKDELFRELVRRFAATDPKTTTGKRILVNATSMETEAMIEAALAGKLDALSPDSSVWLAQLDAAWQEQQQSDVSLIGDTVRFAVSPVTLAMWENVARQFGYPDTSVGWQEIMDRARSDSSFKWSHPATTSSSGLLATLAMFYAGAGKTRGLTQQDVQAESTIAYVNAVEKTVRYYGEGEMAIIQRALQEGPGFLDAFVVPERLVIYYNQQARGNKLVAIYPREGTLWQDHPLALLERADLANEQRQAFTALRDFFLSAESQRYVLRSGYRPADLSIPLDDPDSPITSANGVNPAEPQTTLQIPSANVIEVVRQAWLYTKRHANIILVADVSGSMQGDKLAQAQAAMLTFLNQIQGDVERVGLISFSSAVQEVVPLAPIGDNRGRLESAIRNLSARGNTALLDATQRAYTQLQALNDTERINAIVVMTDGKENNSRLTLPQLTQQVSAGNARGMQVIIFCVAYGDDADMNMLQAIADTSGGLARYGDPESIKELYKILSTYF